jgi:ribosomal protein S18 acetylase RimI-like enzyme
MLVRKVEEQDLNTCEMLLKNDQLMTADNAFFKKEWLYEYLDDNLFFVAEKEDQVVGLVFGEKLKLRGAMLWYIVVKQEFRNTGIGSMLITKFEESCKNQKIEWIILYSNNNKQTLEFYEKHGYSFGSNTIECKKEL